MRALEVWGGVECTLNRVADRWYSQLELTGHDRRLADLDLIAGLGIRTLRYPLLWEQCAPRSLREIDWSWPDERLHRIQQLGIRPIVGLVHHGSGPAYADIASEAFAPGLAEFATGVAQRFPWLEHYTPVNEPLTTARFSGLYGHWYPHGTDDRMFVRTLLNQCSAIRLAMQAIRRVNSAAQLMQTEDLGTTYGSGVARVQAQFDNERRWLSWDLLCGRVDRHHVLRPFLLGSGASADELDVFVHEPCPPQVVGINHYVTSDRYLDPALKSYPPHTWGGNGRERYADVEAVRVLGGSYRGWRVLDDAWARYGLPLAVSEAHIGCSREQQLRWIHDAWLAAQRARERGCAVLALTAWALFGGYDWDSLVTRLRGHYESGAFDSRARRPRPTAIAALIRALCRGQALENPGLDAPGWWQLPKKQLYGRQANGGATSLSPTRRAVRRPLVICGSGSLGTALSAACYERGLRHRLLPHSQLDICDAPAVSDMLSTLRPWAVVNASGYVRVDQAEADRATCYRTNALGSSILARATARVQARLLSFSSDLVFGGKGAAPYVETSPLAPLNVYGRSKMAGEAFIRFTNTDALCVRTAAFFGYWAASDFLVRTLSALHAGADHAVLDDVTVSPTYMPDLVRVCLDLLLDGERGVWHLVNRGAVTWARFATQAARLCGLDAHTLHARSQAESGLAARRPHSSALATHRGQLLPSLDDALERFASAAVTSHRKFWECDARYPAARQVR